MSVGNIATTDIVLRSQPSAVGLAAIQSIEVTQVSQGLTGAPGDTLPGSGDANLEFNQTPASDVWTITHNLNKYPSVTVVDSAGDECEGSVNHISRNLLTITFSAAFSGRAFLN